MATQIPLKLQHAPSFELADFIVSSANEDAVALLENHQRWLSHAVAVVGPEASGKTHLVKGWAAENSALLFSEKSDIALIPPGSIVVCDDADSSIYSDEKLFHLYNWTKEIGGKLLLTGKTHPTQWAVTLPDLRSRLATLTVGEITKPDDQLLMVLLIKLFSDRQLQVDISVIHYILPRVERSFYAVYKFVERLDQVSLSDKRKITRALAKNCL